MTARIRRWSFETSRLPARGGFGVVCRAGVLIAGDVAPSARLQS
jgi:hypothetical protein